MSLERIFYRKHPVVEILLSAGRNACCSLGFRHPLPRTPETPVIPCLSVHLDGSRLSPLLFRPWTYRIPIFGFLLPIMSVRADFVHKLCLRHYRKDTDTSKKKQHILKVILTSQKCSAHHSNHLQGEIPFPGIRQTDFFPSDDFS